MELVHRIVVMWLVIGVFACLSTEGSFVPESMDEDPDAETKLLVRLLEKLREKDDENSKPEHKEPEKEPEKPEKEPEKPEKEPEKPEKEPEHKEPKPKERSLHLVEDSIPQQEEEERLEVTDDLRNYEDASKNRPAGESSVETTHGRDKSVTHWAGLADDGSMESFSMTKRENNAWWFVDLGYPRVVAGFRIVAAQVQHVYPPIPPIKNFIMGTTNVSPFRETPHATVGYNNALINYRKCAINQNHPLEPGTTRDFHCVAGRPAARYALIQLVEPYDSLVLGEVTVWVTK